jgi:hypothetical protein
MQNKSFMKHQYMYSFGTKKIVNKKTTYMTLGVFSHN